MMKPLRFLIAFLVLASTLAPVSGEPSVVATGETDYHGPVTPILEPHGTQVCASGCALSRHPTPRLEPAKFAELIRDFASQPMSEESPALEALLFFGPQTAFQLDGLEAPPLDPERLAFLREELARDQAVMEFRIIDDEGRVRVSLPPSIVNLDKRYVFEPLNTDDFQPPEASGTLKRVGLNHLWQRI